MKDELKNYPSNLDSTNYNTTEFPDDRIENMVRERNKLLIKFGQVVKDIIFGGDTYDTDLNLEATMKFGDSPNVRIIGNPNQPTLVFYNKYVLSMFVKNFNIHLSSEFKNGTIMGVVDLNKLSDENQHESVRDIVQDVVVLNEGMAFKTLKKIERNDEGIYFSKFDKLGNPYYSVTNPQLFFDDDTVNDMVKTLCGFKTHGVQLNIV